MLWPVGAIVGAATGFAGGADPDGVELFYSGLNENGVIREDASFKVSPSRAFHAEAGTGEVGGADVGGFAVNNDQFEVHARAEHPLEVCGQQRVFIEIFAEARTGLFGMNQPDFESVFDPVGEGVQEGDGAVAGFNVQVLDVGGADPQGAFRLQRFKQHVGVVLFVGNVDGFHNKKTARAGGF